MSKTHYSMWNLASFHEASAAQLRAVQRERAQATEGMVSIANGHIWEHHRDLAERLQYEMPVKTTLMLGVSIGSLMASIKKGKKFGGKFGTACKVLSVAFVIAAIWSLQDSLLLRETVSVMKAIPETPSHEVNHDLDKRIQEVIQLLD